MTTKAMIMSTVRLGTSRQVTIPKVLHDRLGLKPGDFFDVELREGQLVYTPKTLVDKEIDARLDEGLEDIREGRVYGPFDSAKEVVASLRTKTKQSG